MTFLVNGVVRLGSAERWALFSDEAGDDVAIARMPEDGGAQYRYALGWRWREDAPMLAWGLLNPSTAHHMALDRTLHRTESFSRSWGYGGMLILNAYAYRATEPRDLPRWNGHLMGRAIGRANDDVIRALLGPDTDLVVGWGVHCDPDRARFVARHGRARVDCLGTNMDGSPCHPLYLAASTKRQPWSPP